MPYPVAAVRNKGFGNPDYIELVKSLSPLAFWPLNEASGTVMTNLGNSALNGSYKNTPVLGQPGIGDGGTSVKFNDGATNQCALPYSAALLAAFNGDEGSFFIWAKVLNSGVWTDGTARGIWVMAIDATNYIRAIRSTTNDVLTIAHRFGAANITRNSNAMSSTTAWFQLGVTWSLSNNRMRVFVNGTQQGTDATGQGDWSGDITNSYTALAGLTYTPTGPWLGWLAHAFIMNREVTPAEVASIYAWRPF